MFLDAVQLMKRHWDSRGRDTTQTWKDGIVFGDGRNEDGWKTNMPAFMLWGDPQYGKNGNDIGSSVC